MNNEPYRVLGPSRVGSGSQEEPIIVSDDDVIKTEKIDAASEKDKKSVAVATKKKIGDKRSKKIISNKATKKASDKKAISSKAKGKAPAHSSPSSSSLDGSTGSSDSPSSPKSSPSSPASSPNVPFYLKISDMPKDLRENLRVSENITN